MRIPDSFGRTVTDESLREIVPHGSEEYPFQYYLEDIFLFDFHCIDWHWHPEVEFVYIKKGTGEFLIGSDRHTLGAGTGIFINSQVIHRFEASESVIIPNIVFSPGLLCPEESLIYRKYIRPVLDSPVKYLIFSSGDPAPSRKKILNALLAVFAAQESGDGQAREIRTAELLLKLWRLMYENMETAGNPTAAQSPVQTQARLQIMMQFIHKNYARPVSLEDIADTVGLSKSSARNIFNRYIHTSPVDYLISYRLKRAAKLLATTENSVSSVARDTGFENAGYFCRKFKEAFRLTPGEYRKKTNEAAGTAAERI